MTHGKRGRNIGSTCFFLFVLISLASAQYGTITLPALTDAGAKIEAVKIGLTYCEGPVCDAKGNFYFSEMNAGNVWKVNAAGVSSKWRTGVSSPNGMDVSLDGRILCCENKQITLLDTNGNVAQVVTQNASYGLTNDLSLNSKGAMYFTNNSTAFYYRSPEGTVTTFNYSNVNGLEWIEEKSFIYVNMCGDNKVVKYTTKSDGTIDFTTKKDFVTQIGNPDGITVDSNYNVYVGSWKDGKVYVYDSTGKSLGNITITEGGGPSGNACNCVFGNGANAKTLYITGNSGAFKVQMKVTGRKRPVNSPAVYYGRSEIGNDAYSTTGFGFPSVVPYDRLDYFLTRLAPASGSAWGIVTLQNRLVCKIDGVAGSNLIARSSSHVPYGSYVAVRFLNGKMSGAYPFMLVR